MGRTFNPTHRWRRSWAEWHVKNGGTYASAPEFYKMACELYLAGATAKAAGISTAALYTEKLTGLVKIHEPASEPVKSNTAPTGLHVTSLDMGVD